MPGLGPTDKLGFYFEREDHGVRAACGLGRVSIPLSGAKASLNVAVAAGILMERWVRALAT